MQSRFQNSDGAIDAANRMTELPEYSSSFPNFFTRPSRPLQITVPSFAIRGLQKNEAQTQMNRQAAVESRMQETEKQRATRGVRHSVFNSEVIKETKTRD